MYRFCTILYLVLQLMHIRLTVWLIKMCKHAKSFESCCTTVYFCLQVLYFWIEGRFFPWLYLTTISSPRAPITKAMEYRIAYFFSMDIRTRLLNLSYSRDDLWIDLMHLKTENELSPLGCQLATLRVWNKVQII